MKMKRKSIALLLALLMCLSLLSGCGADNTPETSEPPSSESTAQPTVDEKEEQPSQEPSQEVPKETEEPDEPEEPAQEPENNAGTEFLALLQEEWNNGFFEGEGPKRTYIDLNEKQSFIYNGVVYIRDVKGHEDSFCSYDIASKEFHEAFSIPTDFTGYGDVACYFMEGNFYFANYFFADLSNARVYDCNGALLNSFTNGAANGKYIFFEKGILVIDDSGASAILLSHDLEKIAEIPAPQHEVEHGVKEDFEVNSVYTFAADGTVYTQVFDKGTPYLYRLNTDTCEWEDAGNGLGLFQTIPFCGKYASKDKCVYDLVTGEQVFEYGELYPAGDSWTDYYLRYFGGDKYLAKKGSEYRWVSLTDLSMSDPLPFPEGKEKSAIILDDTYCVYNDQYGWFLWNYNTGEEETIVMFNN